MIIGISARMGGGKDLTGQIINYLIYKSKWGYKHLDDKNDFYEYLSAGHAADSFWQIRKFAVKMKQCVSIITGIPVEKLEDINTKNSLIGEDWGDITYRIFMQLLGTEVGRSIHPNVWINALFSSYKKTTSNWDVDGNSTVETYPSWIITDCRFENEAEAILSRGGIMIRLQRNSNVPSDHTSETALDNYTKFDYVIDNRETTIDQLIKMVKDILIIENIITKD